MPWKPLAIASLAVLAVGGLVLSLWAWTPREVRAEDGSESPFRNVRLLTHVQSKSEMRALMKEQSRALGVKCVHCHVPGKFHLDEKEAKQVGFEMMKMVRELNETWFPDHEEPVVTCWTCHRGALEPEARRPADTEAEATEFEALEE